MTEKDIHLRIRIYKCPHLLQTLLGPADIMAPESGPHAVVKSGFYVTGITGDQHRLFFAVDQKTDMSFSVPRCVDPQLCLENVRADRV